MQFGDSVYQQGNAQVFHFTQRSRKKLLRRLSPSEHRTFDKKSNAYIVVGDESTLITAGYRNKRLHRS